MKNFKDWYKEVNGKDFDMGKCQQLLAAEGLPMIVSCSSCLCTLLLSSAYIDDKEYIYCPSCAEAEE